MRIKDITDKKFGRLTAIKFDHKNGIRHYWLFKCICGKEKIIEKSHVMIGHTKSCGCFYRKHKIIDGYKFCSSCKIKKSISEFNIKNNTYSGYRHECKECENKRQKLYYLKNSDRLRENSKLFYQKNKNICYKINRAWKIKNKDKVKEYQKNYDKEYCQINKEKIKIRNKKYRQKNKKVINKNKSIYKKERRKKDIDFKLKENVSALMRFGLKRQLLNKNGKSTFGDILLYELQDMKKHLEKYFEPWMNWDNWGNKSGWWTIDHTIPQDSFNFANPDGTINLEEVRKCWALKNLRPMEFMKNVYKSNKII